MNAHPDADWKAIHHENRRPDADRQPDQRRLHPPGVPAAGPDPGGMWGRPGPLVGRGRCRRRPSRRSPRRGIFAVGAIQHRFSALAHDASHYALFRNPLANELAGDLFLMFPIFGMTQRFRASHLGHHRYLNDPDRDPDIARLNDPTPHRFPMAKGAFVRRYVVEAALWPPATLRYLFGQAKGANSSDGAVAPSPRTVYRFRLGRCLRGAYWLSVLAAVQIAGLWPMFFLVLGSPRAHGLPDADATPRDRPPQQRPR